jgi:hypothetical protein
MVEFVDPRAEPGAPVESYTLSVDVEARSSTIGLVANGFPDSEAFLDQVEKALAVALPEASFRRWNKGNASAMISDAMLDEVVADCDAVVGAYGH